MVKLEAVTETSHAENEERESKGKEKTRKKERKECDFSSCVGKVP